MTRHTVVITTPYVYLTDEAYLRHSAGNDTRSSFHGTRKEISAEVTRIAKEILTRCADYPWWPDQTPAVLANGSRRFQPISIYIHGSLREKEVVMQGTR